MKIQEFCDMDKFEQIMKNWAESTGLAQSWPMVFISCIPDGILL